MYRHFKAINDAIDIPIIIYNIPPRSVVDMQVSTMARLAELKNIVGVKDATSDLTRPIVTRNAIGADFIQLSGEDGTALPFLAAGGVGCISVTSNIAPRMCATMQKAWRDGDMKTVMNLQDRLMPLHQALFCETSPGPVKYAASLLGKCTSEVRLPLVAITESSKQRVKKAMVDAGLLN
jgi:4-hydroxy-tetrahydrodipicolinate synthase